MAGLGDLTSADAVRSAIITAFTSDQFEEGRVHRMRHRAPKRLTYRRVDAIAA